MFVLEVIPIAPNAHKETLTYFTKDDIQLGSVIQVPLRNKKIPALVIGSQDAREVKSSIKSADFELRKIDLDEDSDSTDVKNGQKNSKKKLTKKPIQFFSSEFIQAVIKTSDYFAATSGAVLNTVVGRQIFTQILPKTGGRTVKIMPSKPSTSSVNLNPDSNNNLNAKQSIKSKWTPLAVQGSDQDRLSSYRSRIRQAFASKKSVVVCVPTIDYADYICAQLSKGLEDYTVVLHGGLSPKRFSQAWHELHTNKHPMLTISTAPYISSLRSDTSVIILEQEHHRAYRTLRRPYIDLRFFIETLASAYGYELILGDLFLRPDVQLRIANDLIQTSSPFSWRVNSSTSITTELIDMKQYKSKGENKSFRILADQTANLIKRAKEESERMIILAVRRGLAPQTICADCQTIVTCNRCSAPIVLHAPKNSADIESGTGQYFLCHKCGDKRSADETCKNCGSWNLGVVGIGIDLVEEKIRANFPDTHIIRIDSDTTPNVTTLRKALEDFRNHPGSILLGTEMMLSYLHEPVGYSAVISLDSLFGLPDFRIGEKIINILSTMRSLTSNHMIVQTRRTEEKILDFGLKGNLSQYNEYELGERKNLNQPPYSLYIKITIEGERERISQEMHKLQNELDKLISGPEASLNSSEFDIFPAFTHTVRGNFVLHGLIKIPVNQWPHSKLLALLRSLPLHYTVKVDPDSLL